MSNTTSRPGEPDSFDARLERDLPRGAGRPGRVSAAGWMDAEELSGRTWAYESRDRLLLGYRYGKPIGTGDNRHVLLCAGSRAGKSISYLAPHLAQSDNAALVLDPKGELAAMTARRRAEKGQKVIILDPFGASKADKRPHLAPFLAHYNPLLDLKPGSDTSIDDAAVLADALIQIPTTGERHWAESAQQVLRGIILMVVDTAPEAERHFGTVRDILMGTDREMQKMAAARKLPPEIATWAIMRDMSRIANGIVAGVGATMLEMGEKERGSVLSAARTQTQFLDSPKLRDLMSKTTPPSFRLGDIKRGFDDGSGRRERVTVYLCLPATMMGSHGRWMRLMISLALIAFERAPNTEDTRRNPAFFILEELATTIGYMRQLESAAGLMAGYGIKLWSVIQDLTQLKHHYRNSWETFIGNAGTTIWFGNSDLTTLEYISKKLGQTGFLAQTPSRVTPGAVLQGASRESDQLRVDALLSSAEVEQALARETGRALILAAGSRPFIVKRADCLNDPHFKPMVDAHEEP